MVTDEPNESEDFIMVAKNAPKAAAGAKRGAQRESKICDSISRYKRANVVAELFLSSSYRLDDTPSSTFFS